MEIKLFYYRKEFVFLFCLNRSPLLYHFVNLTSVFKMLEMSAAFISNSGFMNKKQKKKHENDTTPG